MPDINANDLEAAKNTIAGTARSMGLEVERQYETWKELSRIT
jgi:ribosomal protein L11